MAAKGSGAKSVRKGANTSRRRAALGRGLNALMASNAVAVEPSSAASRPDLDEIAAKAGALARPIRSRQTAKPSFEELDQREEQSSESGGMLYLPIEQVYPNKTQPRQYFSEEEIDSLSKSIRDSGLLQPIVVRRRTGEVGPLASYEIVAGERRWRAAQKAELKKIPALLRQLSDRETLELGIVENVQRADLNPIEEAQAFARLVEEFGASQSEVAETVGKDRASVANAMRLLKLAPEVQRLIIEGHLSAGHGRALLMLNQRKAQLRLAERVIRESLSVRATEALVSSPEEERTRSQKQKSSKSPAHSELEERLRRVLGTKVKLQMSAKGRGELKISFFSEAELESLLDRLGA